MVRPIYVQDTKTQHVSYDDTRRAWPPHTKDGNDVGGKIRILVGVWIRQPSGCHVYRRRWRGHCEWCRDRQTLCAHWSLRLDADDCVQQAVEKADGGGGAREGRVTWTRQARRTGRTLQTTKSRLKRDLCSHAGASPCAKCGEC